MIYHSVLTLEWMNECCSIIYRTKSFNLYYPLVWVERILIFFIITNALNRLKFSVVMLCFVSISYINFTLYHARSRVGRGILMLRKHSVLSGGTQRRALSRHQSENIDRVINLDKYFISSRGIKPTTSGFYSHTVHLRYDWPQCFISFVSNFKTLNMYFRNVGKI